MERLTNCAVVRIFGMRFALLVAIHLLCTFKTAIASSIVDFDRSVSDLSRSMNITCLNGGSIVEVRFFNV